MKVFLFYATATYLAVVSLCSAQEGHEMMPGIMVMPSRGGISRLAPMRRRPVRIPLNANGDSGRFSSGPNSRGPPTEDARIFFPVINRPVSGVIGEEEIIPLNTNDIEASNSTMQLPDDFDMDAMDVASLKTLSSISTIEEFTRMFGLELPPEEDFVNQSSSISVRFGNRAEVPTTPMQAQCEPEISTVKLELPQEDHVMYFPNCVRLPRCGGCCTSHHLKCQPTQVAKKTFKILRIEKSSPSVRVAGPSGRSRRIRRRRRRETTSNYYLDEVEHVACSCLCRVQEKHCNVEKHTYDENTCSCKCKNQDEQEKCAKRVRDHYWSNNDCTCRCNKEQTCSTSQYFDHTTCSCRSVHLRGSGGDILNPRSGISNNLDESNTRNSRVAASRRRT